MMHSCELKAKVLSHDREKFSSNEEFLSIKYFFIKIHSFTYEHLRILILYINNSREY